MKPSLSALLSLLLLAMLATPIHAQQRQITGTVVGPQNQPLPLAAVTVVETGTTVTTDAQGDFRVTAPSAEVRLRFESLGYTSATVAVAPNQSRVEVSLEIDVLNLEGIVVTGQATTVARRNLANAVSTITPQMIESAPPAQSIEKVMQGQVPGALIEQNSGAPGGGIQVRLRGVSTLIGESEPLYVVDGVIVSNVAIPSNANAVTAAASGSNPSLQQDAPVNRIADLLPQDIESIEILKGASAAALYGSRAANGVILITTKRGQPGDARVSVTQRFGVFDLSEKFGFRQWTRDEAVEAFEDPSLAEFFNDDGTPINAFDHEELLAGENDLSWETQASVSGGDEDTRYYLAGSWKEDAGIIRNTGYEKQGLRLNLEQQVGGRLQLSASTNVVHSLANRGLTNNDNSGTSYYMAFPSTPNFVDLRGDGGVFPENPFERSNPLQTAALVQNDEDVWRVVGGLSAELDLYRAGSHDLQLLGTFGVDFFTQENDLFFPPELEFEDDDGLPGTSLLSNTENTDLTLSGHVVHTFDDPDRNWNATTTAGLQFEDRELSISRITARGLTAGQPNVNSGVVNQLNENRQRIKDLGFFAQEEVLLLDQRLMLTAGIRADRSSVNAETDEYFWYPKASGSYRFEELTSWLDALKLRAAWGQSGNQPLFGQKFTPLTATTNIDGLPGLVVQGTVAAPDLRPEQQSEIEFGADLTLFDGSAQLEATYFQKTIDDLLLQRTPAPATGFAQEIFNGGELEVTGLELALSATPLRRGGFNWVTRTTFYADDSEITELPVPAFEVGGFGTGLGAFRVEEGRSATQIVGRIGIDENGEDIVEVLGDATPDFRMGFSNDFTWRNLTLRSLFDWASGNSVINLTRLLVDAGQNSTDFASPEVDCGELGTLGAGTCRILTWAELGDVRPYVEEAGYVKLRELSLSYDVPRNLVTRVFGESVESTSLVVSGRDLATWTDYTGLDPEVSNFGNQPIARNIDVAPYPPSRSWWFSVSLAF